MVVGSRACSTMARRNRRRPFPSVREPYAKGIRIAKRGPEYARAPDSDSPDNFVGFLHWTDRAHAQAADVQARTRAFLDSYMRSDSAAVLASIDESSTMYGSDQAEVFRGAAGVREMMREDARLWGGNAVVGQWRDVSVVHGATIESIVFNAPFSVGKRPAVPVRFAVVWRKTGKRWILVQGSNAVVTQGQSAAEILKGNTN